MGELGVQSLIDVYKMSWREFQLRLIAYKRMQTEKQLIARQMTYFGGYALHAHKPKSIEQFWKIHEEEEQVNDSKYERMKQAMQREWSKLKQLHPDKYN